MDGSENLQSNVRIGHLWEKSKGPLKEKISALEVDVVKWGKTPSMPPRV